MQAVSSVHIHPSFAWSLTNDAAAEGKILHSKSGVTNPTQQKKGKAIHIDFPHIK